MKKLSIIVPVYNAEKWLRRCVDSLLNQDLPREDYEIILVDDGSTDGSLKICDEYLAAHPGLVRVIHQPNSGVSMARNAALDAAVGDYVMFVDADDYVKENSFLEILNRCTNQHLDLCFYKMSVEDSFGNFRTEYHHNLNCHAIYTGEGVIVEGYPVGSACEMFVSSTLIKDNKLRFNKELSFSEDTDFVTHCLLYANRVGFMDVVPYIYAYNEASATNTPKKTAERILSCAEMASRLMQLANDEQFSIKLRKYLRRWANSITMGKMISLIGSGNSQLGGLLLERSKTLGLYPIKGRTKSWKTTLLIPFINSKHVIKWVLV